MRSLLSCLLLAQIAAICTAFIATNPISLPTVKCPQRQTFVVRHAKASKSSKGSSSSKAASKSSSKAGAPKAAASAPTPKAASATPVNSVRKSDLIKSLAEQHPELLTTKKDAEKVVNALLDTIMDSVAEGNKVSLSGFGSFSLQHRAARKGRNPQTGEELQLPASDTPKFTPAKAWKDAVNGRS